MSLLLLAKNGLGRTSVPPEPPVYPFAPNQPVDHTVIMECPFSGAIAHNVPIAADVGSAWWCSVGGGSDRLTQDATFADPVSPGGSARWLFPTGLTPGAQPGGQVGRSGSTEYDEMYGCQLVCTGTVADGFEMQQVGVKLYGQVGVGVATTVGANSNELIAITKGTGTSEVVQDWELYWQQQGTVSRNFWQNRASTRIAAGHVALVEWFGRINTIGVADGVFCGWTNGILTHEYTDVVWRTEATPVKFYGVKIDPIWGGTGGPSRSRDDHHWLGHYRVTGRIL